jgi:hypothetical protein
MRRFEMKKLLIALTAVVLFGAMFLPTDAYTVQADPGCTKTCSKFDNDQDEELWMACMLGCLGTLPEV